MGAVVMRAAVVVGVCLRVGVGKTDCQIRQENKDLTYESFMSQYFDKAPVLIKGGADLWTSLGWSPEDFVARYGDFDIHLRDKRELPELGRRARVVYTTSVRDFVESGAESKLPLFDNRFTPLTRALRADLDYQQLPTRMIRETPIVSIGSKGTGVGFHAHSENWVAQLGGRKAWLLVDRDSQENPEPDPNPCGSLKNPPKGSFEIKRCIARPGDIIYLPGGWAHATCNLDQWTLGVGAQSTIETRSPITAAVMDGAEATVSELVAKGGQKVLYDLDVDGDTPARVAAHTGSASMLALLVKLGLSFEKDDTIRSDKSGRGVFLEAASYGHKEVVDWLLENGVNPNWPGSDDSVPLHHACLNGHAVVVRSLLAHPSTNELVQNEEGNTPMHNAARSCAEEIMGLFIKKNPEVLLTRNKAGLTPVSVARQQGCDNADVLGKAAVIAKKLHDAKQKEL